MGRLGSRQIADQCHHFAKKSLKSPETTYHGRRCTHGSCEEWAEKNGSSIYQFVGSKAWSSCWLWAIRPRKGALGEKQIRLATPSERIVSCLNASIFFRPEEVLLQSLDQFVQLSAESSKTTHR